MEIGKSRAPRNHADIVNTGTQRPPAPAVSAAYLRPCRAEGCDEMPITETAPRPYQRRNNTLRTIGVSWQGIGNEHKKKRHMKHIKTINKNHKIIKTIYIRHIQRKYKVKTHKAYYLYFSIYFCNKKKSHNKGRHQRLNHEYFQA